MNTFRTRTGEIAVMLIVVTSVAFGSPISALAESWTVNGANIYNNNTGNVGIGTSSPQGILHLSAPTAANLIFNSNAAGAGPAQAGIQYKDNGVLRWEWVKNSLNEFKLNRYSAAGAFIDQPITVGTAGLVTLLGQMSKSGGVTTVGPSFGVGLNVNNSGKVGIGTTTPTAALHLKAGTTSANTAPLKFTSGTLLTNKEAGTVEYDGTHLYFTAVDAGTRYQLDQQSASGTTGTGAANALTGTVLAANVINSSISTVGTLQNLNVAGNVGIKTSTPTEALDVTGNVKLSGNIISNNDICIGTCQ